MSFGTLHSMTINLFFLPGIGQISRGKTGLGLVIFALDIAASGFELVAWRDPVGILFQSGAGLLPGLLLFLALADDLLGSSDTDLSLFE